MSKTPSPTPRTPAKDAEQGVPPKVSAAKGHNLDDDFGDFNEEDFDDDFDDDFEEEMDDEYELSEIEGGLAVKEVDDEDLADLPLDTKLDVKIDEDLEEGFDDVEPVAVDEEEEEFEEGAE